MKDKKGEQTISVKKQMIWLGAIVFVFVLLIILKSSSVISE